MIDRRGLLLQKPSYPMPGLWLPRTQLAAPWRFLPCQDCCTEPHSCPCTGDLPTEVYLTLGGFGNASCSDCGDYNTTHVLAQGTPGGCTYSAAMPCNCLMVFVYTTSGSDYWWYVTLYSTDYCMGIHPEVRWRRNWGTSPPSCTGTDLNIPWVSGSALVCVSNLCTFSGTPTCLFTAAA